MTPEQAAAFVHAQSVAALAEIEAMKAANAGRESLGRALAYDEKDFMSVPAHYQITHNQVVALFNEVNQT